MLENLGEFKRDFYCGDLTEANIGEEVRLVGWADSVRDHGGVIFINLRDREGIVQIVIDPSKSPKEAYEKAKKVRSEYVLAVRGRVNKRPEGTENPKLKTGNIEVEVDQLKILNTCDILPFPIEDGIQVSEEVRLKYRFLDIRRPSMFQNLLIRHEVYQATREFLVGNGFMEVETPMLTKSTPEGARDFLVPSRLEKGKFYALPQSPQLFKQILMVAGIDRYFQIVKCFRDEDLRKDRQPEFTQIDFEMSFVDEEDVMAITEGLVQHIFKKVLGIDIKLPIKRITYQEAMEKYGTDKPDLRFGLELKDITDIAKEVDFKVFRTVAEEGGLVKGINIKGGAKLSRKEIDELTEFAQKLGAKGMAWIKINEDGSLNSPIVKFFTDEQINKLIERMEGEKGDLLVFIADKPEITYKVLGHLRNHIAQKMGLIPEGKWEFVWVVDFPLLEWDEEENRLVALHHPFTSPKEEDIQKLDEAIENKDIALQFKSRAYDLVLNGEEIAGGSIRIHRPDIQKKIFQLIGITDEEAEERFGFLINALKYGAPPHGGLAFGLDRLVALMRGTESIREVIAFPKTQKGICPLTEAPDFVDKSQLEELGIEVEIPENEG
ncbi:MAG: aspartate--tRNA ligase [Aquificae bacterium]|nr:aspartate--tRNA ligase [Aquificota bacterium]